MSGGAVFELESALGDAVHAAAGDQFDSSDLDPDFESERGYSTHFSAMSGGCVRPAR